MKITLTYFFALLLSVPVFSQKKELHLNSLNDQSIVMPLGQAGLALYYETESSPIECFIDKYDTVLSKLYHAKIEVPVGQVLIDYTVVNDKIIMLFTYMGELNIVKYFKLFGRTTQFKYYTIVVFDTKDKTQKKIESSFNEKFTLSKLLATEEDVFILGNLGMDPMSLCIDLKSTNQLTKSFLPEGQTKGILKFVENDEKGNAGNAIVKLADGDYIMHYSLVSSGIKIDKTWKLELEEGKEIVNCKFSGNYMMGSYQKKVKKLKIPELPFKQYEHSDVIGVFVAKISGESFKFINYLNLIQLDSVFKKYVDYEDPYKVNIMKQKFANNPTHSMETDILLTHIIELKDDVFFVGETYSLSTNVNNGYYGFGGYKFNDGFMICVSKEGKIKWHDQYEIANYIERTDYSSKRCKDLYVPHAAVRSTSEDLILSVYTGGYVTTYAADDNELMVLDQEPVLDKKITMGIQTNLIPWYANKLIGFGVFDILNKGEENHNMATPKTTVLHKITTLDIEKFKK